MLKVKALHMKLKKRHFKPSISGPYDKRVAVIVILVVAVVGIAQLFKSRAEACRTVLLSEPSIRQALSEGGCINLPAGTVEITKPLRVTQSNTKLQGAGQDVTILRMNFPETGINYGPLIAIPGEWSTDFGGGNPPPESMRVSGVEISHLSIDGAREGNPNTYGGAQDTTIRFGIQSTVSTDTWIHNVHLYDIAGDAIGFGNGSGVNIRPKVEDVLIERAGRNGIHLGHTEDAAIRRSKIHDTPGIYWPDSGAGNGIDIEVEGYDPHVFRTIIEDNEIFRINTAGVAGFGIQVTRAFGDVDDLLIQRNTFKNHQEGVLVSSATNTRILNNTFLADADNHVTGGGVALLAASGYPADAYVAYNTFSLEDWYFCDNVVNANGTGNWRVEDNIMLGCYKVFMAYGNPSHIDSARNQYRSRNNGPFFDNSMQPASTISDVGSTTTITNSPPPAPSPTPTPTPVSPSPTPTPAPTPNPPSPSPTTGTPFVTNVQKSNTIRRDFTGWVGMKFTVGASDIAVNSVGRYVLSGNSQAHLIKLVNASSGADVPGGSASVPTAGLAAGGFNYANLSSPVTLGANTAYYLVSEEAANTDGWYNYDNMLTTTSVAAINGTVYATGASGWQTGGSASNSYVPVSFTYSAVSSSPPSSPAPTPSTSSLLGDTNHDGKVNFDDALYVIRKWNLSDATADLDKNGTVNFDDALLVIRNWKN